MLFFIDTCSNSLSKDIFPLEPWIQAFSGDYWKCKLSKVLFRSTFLASRICLKSLEHLSLNIYLIYEKFPKNLKHKYLTVITFFFTHVQKNDVLCLYPTSLYSSLVNSPSCLGDFIASLPILNANASAWVLEMVRFTFQCNDK